MFKGFLVFLFIIAGCGYVDVVVKSDESDPNNNETINNNANEGSNVFTFGDIGPAGGVIFYVDEQNEFDWTYLETAPESLLNPMKWSVSATLIGLTGEEHKAIGSGSSNTSAILQALGSEDSAAKACAELEVNGFSDFFLPSLNELLEMYNIINAENNVQNGLYTTYAYGTYWSSSEESERGAWSHLQADSIRKTVENSVFCIRAF